jgi:hypothetical protein
MKDTETSEGTGFSVERPEVARVLESATGDELAVGQVIGSDYERLIQLRLAVKTRIKEGEPLYLCAECFTPVYLCCRKAKHRFFFRHTKEDGTCSAVTRGVLSQDEIDARKYNGAKESFFHRQMKQWLVESLEASGKFVNIAQEQRWKGPVTGAWRKPDVSARYQGLPVAFEVQLSTTFLDVIAGEGRAHTQSKRKSPAAREASRVSSETVVGRQSAFAAGACALQRAHVGALQPTGVLFRLRCGARENGS